jgi:hypothetical protein
MTTYEQVLYDLCKVGQDAPYKNIVRNLCYDGLKLLEPLRDEECKIIKQASREDVMLFECRINDIAQVLNPKLQQDKAMLMFLKAATDALADDKLQTNLLLGIPKEC